MPKSRFRGGSVFVGAPYSASNWGRSNHYGVNTTPRIFQQYGGTRRKKRRRKLRGGGWFMDSRYNYFQPAVSALGQVGHAADSAVRTLMGRGIGTNPSPTSQLL